MVKLKMAQTIKEAVTYIEQGHVKVGLEIVTDPAFHVNRIFEDYVTWKQQSKIREKVLTYNNEYDDYDIMNWKHWRLFELMEL